MSGAVVGLPIGLLVGLVCAGALVVLVIGRRRLSARASSESNESGVGSPSNADASGVRSLPRWLDPAVAAARRPDRSGALVPDTRAARAPARLPMVFVTAGDDLAGLHHVRYDGVPLLDRPDDALGWPMFELDGGDEVSVLERAEIWSQVRTPTNLVGWVPSMTLVAVSTETVEEPADVPVAVDVVVPEVAEEPIALEAILEAVAARRLAFREAQAPDVPAPASPRRKARTPKAEAPTPPTRRRRQPANGTPAEEL